MLFDVDSDAMAGIKFQINLRKVVFGDSRNLQSVAESTSNIFFIDSNEAITLNFETVEFLEDFEPVPDE